MTSPTSDRRQGLVGNTPIKAPVDCATTDNIALSGEQVVDGFQTAASRVLVWQQNNPTENGIYDSSSASWTRSADADGNYDLVKGTLVAVTGGSQAGLYFHVISANPIVIGGSQIAFAQDLTNTTSALSSALAASNGTSLIGWLRAVTSSVLTTLQAWLGWQEINAFEFMTVSQIAAVQAGTSPDLSAPLQAWINACVTKGLVGRLPAGGIKYTTTPHINGPVTLRGHGISSQLQPQGCDGISVNSDHVNIEEMGLFSYSSGGAADPRTFTGIVSVGVSGANRNYVRTKNLYMQGWGRCISWQYTWQSQAERIVTVNSNVGIDIFGQSVNNHIDSCDLVVNGGTASIQTRKDGAIQGEGLFISGTLMASGQNAILSDGFLSIGIDASCMADLIQANAFDMTGVSVFRCNAQWVYSNQSCFYAHDLGSVSQSNWDIDVGQATCAGSAHLFYWGSNNVGLKLGGNLYLPLGTGYPVNLNGSMADISATITNGTGNAAVRVNSTGNTISTTGDRSVEWDVSPIAQVGNTAALTLPRGTSTVFLVVGSTSITSIAAANWAGLDVTLIFQGVLTVTDGSNLKLNGNFVTTADDVLRLACDGTSWFEISRSVN